MSKRLKINIFEAGRIVRYYATAYTEMCAMSKILLDLIEPFNLLSNDEIFFENEKILGIYTKWMLFNMNTPLIDDLNMIMVGDKKYTSETELRKFKIDINELPTSLEESIMNFFNKVNAVVEDTEAVEASKTEALKNVKNIYFLVDKLNKILENIL